MPIAEQQIDDITAANLATQLLGQLEAKIAQIPNDPDKYMSKTKLSEMYDNLKVCNKQVTKGIPRFTLLMLGHTKKRGSKNRVNRGYLVVPKGRTIG